MKELCNYSIEELYNVASGNVKDAHTPAQALKYLAARASESEREKTEGAALLEAFKFIAQLWKRYTTITW